MKYRIAFAALALALSLTACGGNPAPADGGTPNTPSAGESTGTPIPEGALVIAEQGMFSSGGTVTEPVEGEYDETTNWLELERHGNTAHVGHANVLYQIPAEETGLPIVYLHGYGQSRMGWMTTPDGRDGWSTLFLQKGHSAFLVDQPGRGEAGAAVEMTMENRYSMMARQYEALFPVLEELGVGLVAFSPMANGFLSGRYGKDARFDQKLDYRSNMPQFTSEAAERNRELLALLDRLAKRKNATSAQISLAWMLCKKPWIVPIPGTRKPERMRENAGAAEVRLSAAEVETLDQILDTIPMSAVFGGSKVAGA